MAILKIKTNQKFNNFKYKYKLNAPIICLARLTATVISPFPRLKNKNPFPRAFLFISGLWLLLQKYCPPSAFQIYSSTMCPVDTVHLLLLTFSNQKVLETCHYQRSLVFSLNASYMININFCSYMFQANCPVLIKKSVRQIPEKVAKSRHTLLILPLLNA